MLAKLAGLLGVLALLLGYYLFSFPAPSFQVESNKLYGIVSFIVGGVLLGSFFLARSINRSRSSMNDAKTISTATDEDLGKAGYADRKQQQDDPMLKQQAFTQQQQMNKQSQDMFMQQREMAKKQQEEWRRQQEQQRRRQ
jgi:membrane protein involved in colicin uptake